MANKVAFKCNNCGDYFPWEVANKQKTVNRGKARYICPNCATVQHYGAGNTNMVHIPKKHEIGIGFELECIPHSHSDYCSMISSIYKMVPTRDGSLPTGGVEFNTPVYRNMSGLKQMFRSFEKFADFADEHCGHHINISHQTATNWEGMELLREHARAIFDPLMEEMRYNSEATRRIWGRNFCYYAADNTGYCKYNYSWINLDANNRIEFRLAKFVDAKQYLWLSFFCKEIVECIVKNFLDCEGLTYSEICDRADMTGKKLVKMFDKYANGKANCQRPERNSK